jgi:two-component system, OmpR family, response regulator VicR
MRILYVEDEPFLSKIVKESLESRHFTVELVEDGDLVLPALEKALPDICILDVMLPNRDGFSIGQEIRARYPTLPIIFVTAKQQTADVVQGFASGGNDYIRKPFSMEELIVRIHNLLTMSTVKPTKETILRLGRYQFDIVRQVLVLETRERQLSHRETQVLSMLAQSSPETITRKTILDQVWGNDSIYNSRNLDVYITRLRDYLRDDDTVHILTLKGVGYRLLVG